MKKIKSVRYIDASEVQFDKVHDIEVANNHNYILANGAVAHNSGKGFQIDKLLGIQGKTFDVDALKKLASKAPNFAARVKKETGVELKGLDLRQPENVAKIHELLADVYGITKKHQATAFASIVAAPADRKPNLIFDVTLKDMAKLASISRNVSQLGYNKQNVHIVWVVNDVGVAMQQNQQRDRVVPKEILMTTHEGAALTMRKILNMGDQLTEYMDGAIYISFNKVGVDTDLAKSDRGGSYLKDANYIRVKSPGQPQTSTDKLEASVYQKIQQYVPKTDTWQ